MEIRIGDWVQPGFSIDIDSEEPLPEEHVCYKTDVLKGNREVLGIPVGLSTSEVVTLAEAHLGKDFNKRLWEAEQSLWIEPKKDIIHKYCFYLRGGQKRRMSSTYMQIRRVWAFSETIEQVIKDRQFSIVPLIIYFGVSPAALKRELGKGLWKKLASSSVWRIKLYVDYLVCLEDQYRAGKVQGFKWRKALLSILVQLKTPLLHRSEFIADIILGHHTHRNSTNYMKALLWVNKHSKGFNSHRLELAFDIYFDTKRMAGQLQKPFNPEWHYARMEQKHNEYAREVAAKNNSKDIYPKLRDSNEEIEVDGVSVKLLRSDYEVSLEGRQMGHCLAGYTDDTSKGTYLAFSLDTGETRSTLGMKLGQGTGAFVEDQHYGRFNMPVEDKLLINAANEVIVRHEELFKIPKTILAILLAK